MSSWTEDQLRRVGAAQELQIAHVRRSGALRARTTIWTVRAGDDLYVRAAYGPDTGWHRVASASRQARIWAGGVESDVSLEQVRETPWIWSMRPTVKSTAVTQPSSTGSPTTRPGPRRCGSSPTKRRHEPALDRLTAVLTSADAVTAAATIEAGSTPSRASPRPTSTSSPARGWPGTPTPSDRPSTSPRRRTLPAPGRPNRDPAPRRSRLL